MQLLTPEFGLIAWSLFTLLFLFLPLIAIFDILRSNFKDGTTKLIWAIVVLFVPLFGVIFYFTIGRKQKIKPA